ncbi:MAG: NAD(P)/FAD-dependent oxidoreductase [Firmicutes bacterium]|nr:NAD(P)/FAD-dependent oxidoreductase [Bacillota bacterium]
MSNILINVDNAEYIEDYRKAGVNAFLFALEGYSVGYHTFSLEEINQFDITNKYILINRLLDSFDVDKLREVLSNTLNIKGIVYEDIAVYMLVKELKLDVECIFFQNHFGTSLPEVNFWLDRVDSMFISNEITKDERRKLCGLIKNLKMTVKATRGYDEAVITCGGIDTDEIDPSTMRSKKCDGLLFAGEVIDVDAMTGGFNLQIAFSTGYLAGNNV